MEESSSAKGAQHEPSQLFAQPRHGIATARTEATAAATATTTAAAITTTTTTTGQEKRTTALNHSLRNATARTRTGNDEDFFVRVMFEKVLHDRV